MQVGFNPVNIKNPSMPQPQRQQNKAQTTNFGIAINVKSSANKPEGFISMLEMGAHEDSKENRGLLKQVINKIKQRSSAKWDLPDIKEAIYKAWGKDDELEGVFKGY